MKKLFTKPWRKPAEKHIGSPPITAETVPVASGPASDEEAISTIISRQQGEWDTDEPDDAHHGTNRPVQIDPTQFLSGNDLRPRTRVEVAHQKLLETSEDLAATLQDYLHIPSTPITPAEMVVPSDEALVISGMVNPDAFARVVERILAKQRERESSLGFRIADALSKLYPLISLTLSLGAQSVSLGGAPFAPLQCVMNGVSRLLSIACQEQSRGHDFLKQFDRILYQSLRIAEIQKYPTVEINELLVEKSTNLMAAIILFFKNALIFFRHDYFYNLGRTLLLGPKIYADARDSLDVAIAEFDQALLLQVTVKILAMGGMTKPVDEHLQKSDLLSWLRSSHWEAEAQFVSNCELRAPGTLQWVLDAAEFKAWRLGDCKANSRSGSLWLSGPAGVGKSIIAAYITQVLQAQYPDAAVLYFFCKAGDPHLDNVDRLIRTLAAQLALTVPKAQQHFQRLKDKGFDSKSLSYLFSALVADTLRDLLPNTFVIIDGLDECFGDVIDDGKDESPIRILLEALQKIEAKILVSSRPTPEITHSMWGYLTRKLTFEDSRDDIERYVSMRVSKSRNLQRGFARLDKEPSTFITEKSQGNFLWVSIVLGLLERTPSANAFQTVIETIPKSLSGMYDRVLDKLEAARTLDVALAVLEYVLFSVVPLTIEQLQSAVGLLQDEVFDLQGFVESDCGAFLGIVPGKSGPSVHIVHETFRSYITDATVSKGRSLLAAKSHARLAGACLRYVMEQKDEDVQPFGDYAARQWFTHFLEFRSKADAVSDDLVVHSLFVTIHRFLTQEGALRQWMRRRCLLVVGDGIFLMRVYMANVYDELMEWLKSDEMARSCASLLGTDNLEGDMKAALDWRDGIVKPDGVILATTIASNMAWVWLNTNWRECGFSKGIFIMALSTARILQLVEPKEEEKPIRWPFSQFDSQYRDPEREKYKGKPGYTWRYPSSISSPGIVNKEQLDVLAIMGGYNPSIGLQSGNYAIGCWFAKADVIVQSYQSAIDEYPEWWHLHEGLGDWYRRIGDNESALKAYAEAMKYDPKEHPSSEYWEVLAKVRENQGDVSGAVDALRNCARLAEPSRIWWYWKQMAEIYEKQKDHENARNIYREAIREHPDNSKEYWCRIADTYQSCLDWKGQLEVYFSAIIADSVNAKEYSKKICRLAEKFKDLMLFSPAITILATAMDRHAVELAQYQKGLADTYMAARQWDKARDLYKDILEGPCAHKYKYSNNDLGHAYLAIGDTTRALAVYYQDHLEDQAKGDYSGLSSYGAPAHMIAKDFHSAIRLLKADITKSHSLDPSGPPDIYQAEVMMKRYFNLGLCYETLNRSEESRVAYSNASSSWQKFKEDMVPPDEDDASFYRSSARPIVSFGYVLEKLGDVEEAKSTFKAAERIFAVTRFVGDDEPLLWEHEECKRALERVSACNAGGREMPSLLEEVGGMRLELRLSQYYRTNWPGYRKSKVPSYRSRGGYEAKFYEGKD